MFLWTKLQILFESGCLSKLWSAFFLYLFLRKKYWLETKNKLSIVSSLGRLICAKQQARALSVFLSVQRCWKLVCLRLPGQLASSGWPPTTTLTHGLPNSEPSENSCQNQVGKAVGGSEAWVHPVHLWGNQVNLVGAKKERKRKGEKKLGLC